MERLGPSEYGVTECLYTYSKVKITATYEKIIEVEVGGDVDAAVEAAFDEIQLDDLDYDWDIVGEKTELVYVKEGVYEG